MSSQSSTGSGKSIFISYRRDDSSANTGRIYDRLIQQFDRESIFKDVDAVPIDGDLKVLIEGSPNDRRYGDLREQMLKKFDKNGDGKLDEKERPTREQFLQLMDALQKAGQ